MARLRPTPLLASRAVKAFKRSLFGYRRAEVERALMARDTALAEGADALAREATELAGARTRIAQLEAVCDALSDRVVARDRELDELRAELGRALARAERNESVGAQAREQATRMRMAALRDAAEVSTRLQELSDAPMAARGRLAESLRAAIERCGERRRAARERLRAARRRPTRSSRAWSRSRSGRWRTSRSWSGSRTPRARSGRPRRSRCAASPAAGRPWR